MVYFISPLTRIFIVPFSINSQDFDPWVRKIPWQRGCLLTPVFLPGEFLGQRILSMGSQRI